MSQDELVSAVRGNADVTTNDEARHAIRATLRALGERLGGGETGDLAAQLPGEFQECLPSEGPGERFGVHDFYERVAAYVPGDCGVEAARRHARAVVAALKGHVSFHELAHVAGQLPDDYRDLLQTEPLQTEPVRT